MDANAFRARYAPQVDATSTRPGRRTEVDLANEVPIQEVLEEMGSHCPRGIVGSWKMPCPWGSEHADGGVEPDFRVYEGNTAHCFAMHGTLTPVSMYARHRGWDLIRAAQHMLARRGLTVGPEDYRARAARLSVEREIRIRPLGTPAQMVAAAQMLAEADPAYLEAEFSDEVMEAWSMANERLDVLMRVTRQATDDDLRRWTTETRDALHAAAEVALTADNTGL